MVHLNYEIKKIQQFTDLLAYCFNRIFFVSTSTVSFTFRKSTPEKDTQGNASNHIVFMYIHK